MATTIDPELLALLACPETKEPVALADDALVRGVNERIARGALANRGGQKVVEPVEGLLLRADRRYAYPVRDGVPIMLIEEALPLAEE